MNEVVEMITFQKILINKEILDSVDGVGGIYKVLLPKEIDFVLKNETTAITEYNGRKLVYDSEEEIETITERWKIIQSCDEDDNNLLYIGCSNDLKRRLKEFAQYGVKKSKTHRGGKIIWQIENAINFQIEIIPTVEYKKEEYRLIRDYRKRHKDQRPIANEKD